jgi:hypothetical protein
VSETYLRVRRHRIHRSLGHPGGVTMLCFQYVMGTRIAAIQDILFKTALSSFSPCPPPPLKVANEMHDVPSRDVLDQRCATCARSRAACRTFPSGLRMHSANRKK